MTVKKNVHSKNNENSAEKGLKGSNSPSKVTSQKTKRNFPALTFSGTGKSLLTHGLAQLKSDPVVVTVTHGNKMTDSVEGNDCEPEILPVPSPPCGEPEQKSKKKKKKKTEECGDANDSSEMPAKKTKKKKSDMTLQKIKVEPEILQNEEQAAVNGKKKKKKKKKRKSDDETMKFSVPESNQSTDVEKKKGKKKKKKSKDRESAEHQERGAIDSVSADGAAAEGTPTPKKAKRPKDIENDLPQNSILTFLFESDSSGNGDKSGDKSGDIKSKKKKKKSQSPSVDGQDSSEKTKKHKKKKKKDKKSEPVQLENDVKSDKPSKSKKKKRKKLAENMPNLTLETSVVSEVQNDSVMTLNSTAEANNSQKKKKKKKDQEKLRKKGKKNDSVVQTDGLLPSPINNSPKVIGTVHVLPDIAPQKKSKKKKRKSLKLIETNDRSSSQEFVKDQGHKKDKSKKSKKRKLSSGSQFDVPCESQPVVNEVSVVLNDKLVTIKTEIHSPPKKKKRKHSTNNDATEDFSLTFGSPTDSSLLGESVVINNEPHTKKRKKKKRKSGGEVDPESSEAQSMMETSELDSTSQVSNSMNCVNENSVSSKKKKRKSGANLENDLSSVSQPSLSPHDISLNDRSVSSRTESAETQSPKKKKRKRDHTDNVIEPDNLSLPSTSLNDSSMLNDNSMVIKTEPCSPSKSKKKKKKKKKRSEASETDDNIAASQCSSPDTLEQDTGDAASIPKASRKSQLHESENGAMLRVLTPKKVKRGQRKACSPEMLTQSDHTENYPLAVSPTLPPASELASKAAKKRDSAESSLYGTPPEKLPVTKVADRPSSLRKGGKEHTPHSVRFEQGNRIVSPGSDSPVVDFFTPPETVGSTSKGGSNDKEDGESTASTSQVTSNGTTNVKNNAESGLLASSSSDDDDEPIPPSPVENLGNRRRTSLDPVVSRSNTAVDRSVLQAELEKIESGQWNLPEPLNNPLHLTQMQLSILDEIHEKEGQHLPTKYAKEYVENGLTLNAKSFELMEDRQIMYNFNKYFEDYPEAEKWKDNPFDNEDPECKKFFLDKQFHVRMAHGILRVKASVMKRLRLMIRRAREGNVSEEQKKRIIEMRKLGYTFEMISNMVGINGNISRFVCEADEFASKYVGFNKGLWKPQEIENLTEAIMKVTGTNLETVTGRTKEIDWDKVTEMVETRNARQCRRRWIEVMGGKPEGSHMSAGQKLEFLHLLVEMYGESPNTCNFEDVAKKLEWHTTAPKLQECFSHMKTWVPDYKNLKTSELVKAMLEVKGPVLQRKIDREEGGPSNDQHKNETHIFGL